VRRALAWLLVGVLILGSVPTPAHAQTTEADVYVAQAIIDFDEKRYAEALQNLQEALKREPDHVEALYYVGVVNMALRKPEEATRALLRAQQKAPQDNSIAFQLALAYFAQQNYDAAEPLFERVFRADPTIEGLGYYVGFIRYRKKDYRGALDAFRRSRTVDPQLQQLTRFYAGLALAVLGLPAQASAEVEQALRLAPGSPLTGPAERLRDTIRAAAQQGRALSASLTFGFFYDDNVIVRPGPNSHEPLVPILRDKKYDSTGETVNFAANYSWLRTESWESSVGYSFFGTYNNDLPSFNVTDHMVSGTLTYKSTLPVPGSSIQWPLQISGAYAWDMLYLDDTEFLRRNTATISAVVQEKEPGGGDTLLEVVRNAGHLSQTFFRFQNKEFFESNPVPLPEEFRDANNYTWGLLHLLRFAGDRHLIKVGYQFDWEDAEGRNYRYLGHRLLFGAQYTVGKPAFWGGAWWPQTGIRLNYDVDVHLRDYYEKNTLLPTQNAGSKWRQDEELNNTVRAEILLLRPRLPFLDPALAETSLSLAATYQNTIANSNVAVFNYTRNVYSLSLIWSY
jgi:tetratricopeptide (TPR) repeat protein